jgi:hypothetical protein
MLKHRQTGGFMKRGTFLIGLVLLPLQGWASVPLAPFMAPKPIQDLANPFASSPETATMEWGCPVADVVKAGSRAEALQKMKKECMDEVRRAATDRPNVVDVIQTSVIFPDIEISELPEGYQLRGTFFLETLVLQRLSPR